MTDNTTLASGEIIEDLDTFSVSGVHSKRQVMSIAPRDLSAADSIGALNEGAPASDTASSGLNGRLQRVAQRLTTLINQFSAPGPLAAVSSTSVTPATTSDATPTRVNAAATTNATNVKAAAGVLRSIDVFNVAGYAVYLKFYNKASAPTVGTDTPVWTIPIPAGGGFSKQYFAGKSFSTGISYAITKLQADSDTTAVAAGDLTGTMDWV